MKLTNRTLKYMGVKSDSWLFNTIYGIVQSFHGRDYVSKDRNEIHCLASPDTKTKKDFEMLKNYIIDDVIEMGYEDDLDQVEFNIFQEDEDGPWRGEWVMYIKIK